MSVCIAEVLSRLVADRQLASEGFFKQQQPAAETRARYATTVLSSIRDFSRI